MSKAVGMIETMGLIGSIEAADAMVKASNVQIISQQSADGGLMTILVEGDVGAVQAAVDAGREAAARVGQLIGAHVIPRPDVSVHQMIAEKPAEKQPAPAASKAKQPKPTPKQPAKPASPPDGEQDA